MAFDTREWLKSLKFSDEKIAALMTDFEPVSGELEKNQLRLNEFTKKMNEGSASIAKKQEEIAAQETKLTAEMAEWAEMTQAEKAANGDLKKQIDERNATIFTMQQKLTRLAEEAGIDPKTVLEGEVKPPKKDEPPPYKDDFDRLGRQVNGFADFMLTLNAELPAIAQEHFELTGSRLDTRAFIAGLKADMASGKASADRLDPVKRWEADFKIDEKRSDKATKEREDWGKSKYEEGRSAALSEAALPNSHPKTFTTSPILRPITAHESVLKRPQPSIRMNSAVSALATGKYRQSGEKKTA